MTDAPGVTRTRPLLQIPAALLAARLGRGWTPRQLAERAGVSVSLVREAERGGCGLSPETLKRIADALGRQVEGLMNAEAVGQDVIDQMIAARAEALAEQDAPSQAESGAAA